MESIAIISLIVGLLFTAGMVWLTVIIVKKIIDYAKKK